MPHVRSQIRDQIKSILTGLATTGARVFKGRTRALAIDHEPTLLIYCSEEVSDTHTMGPKTKLVRTLQVNVEGRAVHKDADGLEDLLDQIASEVEPVMVADPTLNGLTKEVTLTASRITAQSPGESHAGEVRMEYRVMYRTEENAPDLAV